MTVLKKYYNDVYKGGCTINFYSRDLYWLTVITVYPYSYMSGYEPAYSLEHITRVD
jgi:hypothetical protein